MTEVNGALIAVTAYEEGVLSALTHLKKGKIEDAVAEFAEEFRFNDLALGLEFTNKEGLREFLQKERELYPHSSFHVKKSVVTRIM
jgi:hypothetical protein